MLTPEANPLTRAHYDQVMQGLYHINIARQLINAGQQAGLDTRAHTQLADHLEKQLTGIRETFFAAGPPKT
jgi:hypothetical protein